MIWDDILLTRYPDAATLRSTLALLFGVSPRQVGLVHSAAASTGSAQVRGVITSVRGEFRCMLSISIDDALVSHKRIAGVSRLCASLGTSAFISDGSSNPYSGVLIDAAGRTQQAQLDPDAEDRGEYRVWRGAS